MHVLCSRMRNGRKQSVQLPMSSALGSRLTIGSHYSSNRYRGFFRDNRGNYRSNGDIFEQICGIAAETGSVCAIIPWEREHYVQ